ncbi:MAG: hypothetical protein ACE5PM_02015 [Candidatus Hydrothermarchaeales archaeon]
MVGETGSQEKYNVVEGMFFSASHKAELSDIEKGDFVKFTFKGKEYQGIILDLNTRIPPSGGPRSPEDGFEGSFFHHTLSKTTSYNGRILITSHKSEILRKGTDGRLIYPFLAIEKVDEDGIREVIDTTNYDFLFAVTQAIDTFDTVDLIIRIYGKIKGLPNFIEEEFRTRAIEALVLANIELNSGFVGEFIRDISESQIKGVVLDQDGNTLEVLPADGGLRMGDLVLIHSKKGIFVAQVDDFRTNKIVIRGLEKWEKSEDGEHYTPFLDQVERGAVITGLVSDFMTDYVHTPETLVNPISIGEFYYGGEAFLGLHTLGRQGMLVVGGVGQKKTSSLLSIIESTIEKTENLSFLIIDLNDEYATENIIRLAKERRGFSKIPVEEINEPTILSIKDFDGFCMEHGLKGSSKVDHRKQFMGSAFGYEKEGKRINLSKECFLDIAGRVYNKEKRAEIISWVKGLPDELFETSGSIDVEGVLGVIRDNTVTIIDCSTQLASTQKKMMYTKCEALFRALLDNAQTLKRFACILVIDEAHFFAPQTSVFIPVGFKDEVRKTLLEIATIGPRNLLVPWVSTQRLAAVNKTLSTQMGQNILAFNLEDVDRTRLEEIVGRQVGYVEKLHPGECWVKSLGLKTPQIVKINIRDYPKSGEVNFVEKSGFKEDGILR